jgi:hypothetical protein
MLLLAPQISRGVWGGGGQPNRSLVVDIVGAVGGAGEMCVGGWRGVWWGLWWGFL